MSRFSFNIDQFAEVKERTVRKVNVAPDQAGLWAALIEGNVG